MLQHSHTDTLKRGRESEGWQIELNTVEHKYTHRDAHAHTHPIVVTALAPAQKPDSHITT